MDKKILPSVPLATLREQLPLLLKLGTVYVIKHRTADHPVHTGAYATLEEAEAVFATIDPWARWEYEIVTVHDRKNAKVRVYRKVPVTESMQSKGGKARWQGKTKAEKSAHGKLMAAARKRKGPKRTWKTHLYIHPLSPDVVWCTATVKKRSTSDPDKVTCDRCLEVQERYDLR